MKFTSGCIREGFEATLLEVQVVRCNRHLPKQDVFVENSTFFFHVFPNSPMFPISPFRPFPCFVT